MTGSRTGDIAISIMDRIATLTIDRPDKLNALRSAFWSDLPSVLHSLAVEGEVRAILLTGAGDRAFSVGGDISDFSSMAGIDEMRRFQQAAMGGFAAIERCPLTVIAVVNGLALGGGCELTLACDFALAAESARFGMPEARLGLVPGFGVIRAPETIGRAMTKYMIATGDMISAARAMEVGLVQAVVPDDELMTAAYGWALKVAAMAPTALSVGKRLANRSIDQAGFDYSVEAITMLQSHPERQEGVSAFLGKRVPDFSAKLKRNS
jgi:enoyl-CoA hydratase